MAGILTIGKDSHDRAGPTCPIVVKGQTVMNLRSGPLSLGEPGDCGVTDYIGSGDINQRFARIPASDREAFYAVPCQNLDRLLILFHGCILMCKRDAKLSGTWRVAAFSS